LQFAVFTLDVIATSKEEQKVKNFRRFSKIRTAKFIISQQKSLRKSIKSSLGLLRTKISRNFFSLVKITTFWWNRKGMKILTKSLATRYVLITKNTQSR
jgi:hypothetical protein